eukprot:Ihof_evm1s810 gene=Ihof_evmTU1s810
MSTQVERQSVRTNEPVGFSQVARQFERDLLDNGFDFTLMAVGESGLGKSTALNSLFLSDLYLQGDYPPPLDRVAKTMTIEQTVVNMEENGVKLRLTLVDTPGFGDTLDNTDMISSIVEYIERQYDNYLEMEGQMCRPVVGDSRVHAVLYFLPPRIHGLRTLDIEAMKALHTKVNLIPVIAKADTFTPGEQARFKRKVLEDLKNNEIRIFRSLAVNQSDPADVIRANDLQEAMPYAIIGSNKCLKEEGRLVLIRQYPWGVVNIDDEQTSDLNKLRDLLIRQHTRDIIDHTHQHLYEDYRIFKFATQPFRVSSPSQLTDEFEHERIEHERQIEKIENDLRRMFQEKVNEKASILLAQEAK